MGEAKQEEAKVEAKPEEKKEEKKEENKEDKKKEKTEEKKEEKPSPPPPIVLLLDLHCVGCANKIERSIMNYRGVEEVEIDMMQNQVRVKGIVDPQALCSRIQKKTMRKAKVLSPVPPADGDSTKSEVVKSQMRGMTTVELHVSMHCEACAQQLRKKILKMRGVQTVETELSTGKVTVVGTMNSDRLVEYVYQRTRKLAKVVPQPPKKEEEKEEGEKKAEEKPSEGKKEESTEKKKKEENAEKGAEKAPQQQDNADGNNNIVKGGGEEQKKEGYEEQIMSFISEEERAKKMMYWQHVYVIERLPPPQLFSDENPNACCIS